MAKYTPEFKQEVLTSIQTIGKIPTIHLYREKYNIRPETIRLWLNPEKAKLFAEKNLKRYYENMEDIIFKEKRRLLSMSYREKQVFLDYSYTEKQQLD